MRKGHDMSTVIGVRSIPSRQAYSWKEWFILFAQLGKMKISFLATLSAATGYLLTTGELTMHMFVPTAAIFLLASGSCALNQYQERQIDQLMERTRWRPIPSGRLNPGVALSISLGLILLGSIGLFYGANGVALSLGLLAVAWYNGVYTSLKQKTAFAAVPGAVVGVIPPILGWASGGGSILDPRIWGIVFFFFIWQVPHFWLFFLDFSRDYEKAGLPSITKIFSAGQIKRIMLIWLLSTGISGLSIFSFHLIHLQFIHFFLIVSTLWHIWNSFHFFRSYPQRADLRVAFTKLNLYAILVLFLLSSDRLLIQTHYQF
jgi:protoheme IX farnesyltransferase